MEPKPLGNFQPSVPLPPQKKVEKPVKNEETAKKDIASKIASKSLEPADPLDKGGDKLKIKAEEIEATPLSSI